MPLEVKYGVLRGMFISFCITFSCQKLILDKNRVCCAAIAAAFSEIQKSGLSYDKPLNLHGAEGRTRTGTSVNPLDFELSLFACSMRKMTSRTSSRASV